MKIIFFNQPKVNFKLLRLLVWDSAYKGLGEYGDRSSLQALQVFLIGTNYER